MLCGTRVDLIECPFPLQPRMCTVFLLLVTVERLSTETEEAGFPSRCVFVVSREELMK